eukprot:SAG22_NODE_7313_length_752_cov_1.522205_1_plen_186_part_10
MRHHQQRCRPVLQARTERQAARKGAVFGTISIILQFYNSTILVTARGKAVPCAPAGTPPATCRRTGRGGWSARPGRAGRAVAFTRMKQHTQAVPFTIVHRSRNGPRSKTTNAVWSWRVAAGRQRAGTRGGKPPEATRKSKASRTAGCRPTFTKRAPASASRIRQPVWSKTQTGKLSDDMRRGKGPE